MTLAALLLWFATIEDAMMNPVMVGDLSNHPGLTAPPVPPVEPPAEGRKPVDYDGPFTNRISNGF